MIVCRHVTFERGVMADCDSSEFNSLHLFYTCCFFFGLNVSHVAGAAPDQLNLTAYVLMMTQVCSLNE